MNELLNQDLCNRLREVINKTNIFIKDEEESKKFNLVCAVMDRFDSAIYYINSHTQRPKRDMDFITFMNFCCIIKDGINYITKILNLEETKDNSIFKKIYSDYPLNIPTETNFTDDDFFKYFRSLTFAHPFMTDRSIPNSFEGEIQYSPYVFIDVHGVREEKDGVGVMVYSNKREDFSIIIPFEMLKEYIKWKYEALQIVIDKFEEIIGKKEEEWKKHKVNRNLSPIKILEDVKQILEERYIDSYQIDKLIIYLKTEVTKKENIEAVNQFKEKIIEIIPIICDAVDEYKHEKIYEIISKNIEVLPKGHEMMHYQLEKIFGYLIEGHVGKSVLWGQKQAENFSRGFAKKWVTIEPYTMNFDEIKLLVSTVCYLEYNEQMQKN